MSPPFGLTSSAIESINGVFSRHPAIRSAVIYGSRAKGNFKPGSDIDLCLFAEPGAALSYPEVALVLDEIDDVLKRMPSENDRRRYVLDDLDSGYLPDADGYTMTSWLEALKDHVRDRL